MPRMGHQFICSIAVHEEMAGIIGVKDFSPVIALLYRDLFMPNVYAFLEQAGN